jgi:uncharacterized membrane protein HdeD (DUF308 family)
MVGSIDLVVMIAVLLSIAGLLRLAHGLAEKSRRRAWILMTGVAALLLGISIWTGWPTKGLWFVGLCIAIDFTCHGVSWLGIALAEKKAASVANG